MAQKEEEADDNFRVSQQSIKKVDAIMNLDQDDEALRKWKEQLLGSAKEVYSPKNDPRRVVITNMVITCDGRPQGDIKYSFDSKEQLEKFKDSPFILKRKDANTRLLLQLEYNMNL